jgi:transcriptional regulator with XRE-family HTH domain
MIEGNRMRIDGSLNTKGITKEISKRFKDYRIAYPLTQSELAERSMVSLSTIKRFENGEDISLSKLVQLMETLGLEEHFEVLIPDQSIRPSYLAQGPKPRQRARMKQVRKNNWKWGDEE